MSHLKEKAKAVAKRKGKKAGNGLVHANVNGFGVLQNLSHVIGTVESQALKLTQSLPAPPRLTTKPHQDAYPLS